MSEHKNPRGTQPTEPVAEPARDGASETSDPREPPPRERAPAKPGAHAPPFRVVCIAVAASPGGERALATLLGLLSPDTDLAFVVIHPASPAEGAGAADARAVFHDCPLTVTELRAGARLRSATIHVLAHGAQATLADGQIELAERPGGAGKSTPADTFLRSLAREVRSHAVAVVLSGEGSDGALGLEDVKAAGGVTFAEDPRSAEIPSMPRSAVATGRVDFTLDLGELAAALVRLGRSDDPLSPTLADGPTLGADDDLGELFKLLRSAAGVDFNHYKKSTLKRRIQRRVLLSGLSGLREYIDHLESHPEEIHELYQDLLIKVTGFFRDREAFAALKTGVLAVLMQQEARGVPLRVWVPGCSTGEEVYSLAISLLEVMEAENQDHPIRIFGTDVSEAAIHRARAGLYGGDIATAVSPDRLGRFFSKTDGGYQIRRRIRDLCIFSRHDVTADPPFSRLDLISCRNVMIYLEPSLQQRLLHTFHYALKPAGFLLLGSSESIGALPDLFKVVDKPHRIFARKPGAGASYAFVRASNELYGERTDELGRSRGAAVEDALTLKVREDADAIVMTHYAPAGLVIDEGMQILQFRGKTGPYLEPSPGDASLHLFKMARPGLLLDLRPLVHSALRSGHVARKQDITIRHGDELRTVDVEVWPLKARVPQGRCLLVLFFSRASRHDGDDDPRSARAQELEAAQLRRELVASREYLQAIIEELEATNEELQSTNEEILANNEELHSINDELESTTEELQLTNEELTTVNEELQSRNLEMGLSNGELADLLNGVDIPILMLDADLRVRRFTSGAERLLELTPGDVGRPLAELKPAFAGVDLAPLVSGVVGAMSAVERQVEGAGGRWYAMRIRPQRALDAEHGGAVISWLAIDVEAPKRAEPQPARARDPISAVLEATRAPLLLLDGELRVKAANQRCRELLELSAADIADIDRGRLPLLDGGLVDGGPGAPSLEQALQGVLHRSDALVDFKVDVGLARAGRVTLSLSASRLQVEDGGPTAVLLTLEDLTAREEAAAPAPG